MSKKIILLTGGTGFLGRVLVGFLLKNKYKVILLIRDQSDLSIFNGTVNKEDVIFWNIKNGLNDCFSKYKIDYAIHLATVYGRGQENVSEIIISNLVFPMEILELCVKNNVKAFINSDTYFTEKNISNQLQDFYIYTKKDFVKYAKKIIGYSNTKFMNVVIQHMYGPADREHKFIPFIIKELMLKNKNIKLSDGMQKRDFIFVDDVAEIFCKILKNIDNFDQIEYFEAGTGQTHSLRYFVNELRKQIGSDAILNWGALPRKTNEIQSSVAKIYKNKIDWRAKTSIKIGIGKTIKYYEKFFQK
jgi:nucleoside-diphosphate-sugar epimerase